VKRASKKCHYGDRHGGGEVFKPRLWFSWIVFLFAFSTFFLTLAPTRASALTVEEERKLGEEVVREVETKLTLIRDPLILDYLHSLGRELLRGIEPQPFPFRFYLLKDSQLNAFAVPGGHIFLTTGILELVDSEGELAGLLGHEIAHITQRHISRQLEKQKKIGLAAMAAALLGALAGDPRIAEVALAGSMATAQTLFLKYSREDEEEADQYGLRYMTAAGYDPKQMIQLLDKLRRFGSFGSERIPAYMQTHPLTADRMARVEDLSRTYNPQGPLKTADSEAFRRSQLILLTTYGDLNRARNRLKAWSKDKENLVWSFYGEGLIEVRQGRTEEALERFRNALELRPQDPDILREMGQVYVLQGKPDEAIQKLSQALILNPRDGHTAFLLGRAYQVKGADTLALENFQRALQSGTETVELHYYLGMLYGKLNQLGSAHYHFGRSFQLKGDREKALFHYRTALKVPMNEGEEKRRTEEEIKKLEAEKNKEKEKNPERFY